MKIHLGCGQNYLEGYVNIDFPLEKHSVQSSSVADEFKDITKLNYKSECIEEIRLHHVFEHFPRAQALGLLANWHNWLKIGGCLRIEVPDFDLMAIDYLNPFVNHKRKQLILRHIFGSQEADWAVHYHGWSKKNLSVALEVVGFKLEKVEQITWAGLKNIDVVAEKNSKSQSKKLLINRVEKYFSDFLVDNSESEIRLKNHWINQFSKQLEVTHAYK